MRGTSCFAYADLCPEVVFGWAKHEFLTCVRRVGTSHRKRFSSFFLFQTSFKLSDFGSLCWERTQRDGGKRTRYLGRYQHYFFPLFLPFVMESDPWLMPIDLQKAQPVTQTQHAKPAALCTPVWGTPYTPSSVGSSAFSTAFSLGSSLRASYDLTLDDLSFKQKTLKP